MITYSVPKPDLRPAFPTPDLPLLLSRFGDSAAPFVSAELLASYKAAIATIFTPEQAQAILDSLEEKDTNWSNAWFTKLLLSARFAVATTNRLSILISVPGASRERKVATLLRAVGVWSREYVFSARSEEEIKYTPVQKLVEWQLRGLCATFRVPKNPDTCAIEHADPKGARHAVVWCGGAAWRVEVVDGGGVVLTVEEIERQLLEILRVRFEKQVGSSRPLLTPAGVHVRYSYISRRLPALRPSPGVSTAHNGISGRQSLSKFLKTQCPSPRCTPHSRR